MDADAPRALLANILFGAPDAPPSERVLDRLVELARGMATDGAQRSNPMREIFARLGDKWSTLLLLVLRTGDYRHAMLRRLVSALATDEPISQRVFTLRLRALERDGLVRSTAMPTMPPRVDYALTDLGCDLLAQSCP